MLSSAEAPILPKPSPAPRITNPAPTGLPANISVPAWANAQLGANNTTAKASKAKPYVLITFSCAKRPDTLSTGPCPDQRSMLRMQRHSQEQRRQEGEHKRLQERHEQLEQTEQ